MQIRYGFFAPILLYSSFAVALGSASDDKLKPFARTCPMLLRAVQFDDYVSAVKATELTPAALQTAERKIVDSFAQIPGMAQHGNEPLFRLVLPTVFSRFTGAVSAYIKGQTEISDDWADKTSSTCKSANVPISRRELRAAVRAAGSDPEIYRAFAMAEFILQKAPSVEALFAQVQDAVPRLNELAFPGAAYTGPLIGGPRQAEMVRVALQYSLTRPEDHVLEIGYGTPAVLLGFAYYTRIANLTGVDPFTLPANANEILKPAGIELLQGLFPDSQDIMARLKEKSPYSVILALDVVKNRNVLDTNVSPKKFAKTIFDLLDTGGVAILMNDFEEEPYFSRYDAESAGFTVVRWAEVRELSSALRAMMPYDPADQKAGRMKAFVLRKGSPRTERLQVRGVMRTSD